MLFYLRKLYQESAHQGSPCTPGPRKSLSELKPTLSTLGVSVLLRIWRLLAIVGPCPLVVLMAYTVSISN